MDKLSYYSIWEKVIQCVISNYQNRFAHISIKTNAKEIIFEYYSRLNQECKQYYMEDVNGKLDRHKVCACLMFAILQANVLHCEIAESDTDERYLVLNEHLALTVGLSLLRAFIVADITNNDGLEHKQKLIELLDNGIKLPKTNHGNYEENFISELYYTKKFYKYNVLSLSNTLYLLEIYTLGISSITK